MLGKLLLTAVVVYIAYLVIRKRLREADEDVRPQRPGGSAPGPVLPIRAVRAVAYGLLGLMLLGSAIWVYLDWQQQREVVQLQVVNPYTGGVKTFAVRRGDIDGRRFRTLDGREVRIAEMERMVIESRR